MTHPIGEAAVRRTVTVPIPADRAFAVFTEGFATWWPRENAWARDRWTPQ